VWVPLDQRFEEYLDADPNNAKLEDGTDWNPFSDDTELVTGREFIETEDAAEEISLADIDAEAEAFHEFAHARYMESKESPKEVPPDKFRDEWEALSPLEKARWRKKAEDAALLRNLKELKLSLEGTLTEADAFQRIFPHLPSRGPRRLEPRFTLSSECSVKGRRPGFEDAHVFGAVACGSGQPISYAAVFDGHGGSNCSRSVAKVFESLVASVKLPSPSSKGKKLYPEQVANLLRAHFKLFADELKKNGHFKTQGTTMCACLSIEDTVYFLNLGDSIAAWGMQPGESFYKLLDEWLDRDMYEQAEKDATSVDDQWMRFRVSGRDSGVRTTQCHTPVRDKLRILNSGGFVSFGRLNGNLAVARSLGDNHFEGIGSEPEVFWLPRRAFSSPYILMMCDGIFEPYTYWSENPVSPEEATEKIFASRQRDFHRPDIAEEICREAFRRNSHDNLSVMVLRLWREQNKGSSAPPLSIEDARKLQEESEFVQIDSDYIEDDSANTNRNRDSGDGSGML